MASKGQIKAIHAIIQKLGISDAEYRELLSGFGVRSSVEMSDGEAGRLLNALGKLSGESAGFRRRKGLGERETNSGVVMASDKQLRMIEALWRSNPRVRDRSNRGLNSYIMRVAGVSHIEMLARSMVSGVVLGIRNLKEGR